MSEVCNWNFLRCRGSAVAMCWGYFLCKIVNKKPSMCTLRLQRGKPYAVRLPSSSVTTTWGSLEIAPFFRRQPIISVPAPWARNSCWTTVLGLLFVWLCSYRRGEIGGETSRKGQSYTKKDDTWRCLPSPLCYWAAALLFASEGHGMHPPVLSLT